MQLDSALRLSFYATVVMAFVCLGFAELWFLRWIPGFLAMCAILIGVAYHVEGRWLMSERWANRLGIGIALGTLLWISLQVPRTDEELIAGRVPWPAGILPHVGPLLMILLLVKLFRPKPVVDVWVIHLIALMMVLLGCILTGDFIFGFLLFGYLACLLWCLSVFYHVRGHQAASGANPETLKGETIPWRLLGLGKATGCTALAVAGGITIFLMVPRLGGMQWDPTQLSLRTKGRTVALSGADAGIDTGRTGSVEIVDEVAFTVEADDAKGPKLDLDTTMRWRGHTLDFYLKGGRWRSGSDVNFAIGKATENRKLPSLAADEYFLNIRFEMGKGTPPVLADPPQLGPDGEHPYVVLQPLPRLAGSILSAFYAVPGSGTFQPVYRPLFPRPREWLYRQVVVPLATPDVFPAAGVSDEYRDFLLSQTVPPGMASFTLETLLSRDDIPEVDLNLDAQGRLPVASHTSAARALEYYLSSSGVYTYSLILERSDRNMDPTMDFLVNVRKGHCERYACALALMLRSLGIPARVVKGYRGVESYGDGSYVVRQNQAHAWVEALVPDEARDGEWTWLVLDPTPSFEGEDDLSVLSWLSVQWRESMIMWRNFVLEYDTDRQQAALRDVWRGLTRRDRMRTWGNVLYGVGGLAGLLLAFRVWRRIRFARAALNNTSPTVTPPHIAFYKHFLEALKRHAGLVPRTGETPHEFGRGVMEVLSKSSHASAFAGLPQAVISLLYRVRFGGEPLPQSEAQDIEHQVEQLASVLKMAAAVPAA